MNLLSPLACIETLESRDLFAGVFFGNHRLTLTGNLNYSNTITVGLTSDGLSVSAEVVYRTAKRTISYSKIVPLSDGIRLVIMQGGSKDDIITVDQTYGSFPIRCGIEGGNGSDTITGGDAPNLIYGGMGDDLIYGGAGNDTILGQAGDDTIYGGDGNDYINGADGHDMLYGGNGNDTLTDAQGPDTVIGGPGNNTFYIPSLVRDRDNDYDKTKDKIHFVTDGEVPPSGSTSLLTSLFPILSIL